jgi:beta-phosphoglucomutase-like phosphatase (HAD superfamily)
VIEDSPAGIASAHAAGMYVVAVTSTHTPAELEEADAITGSLLDIQILPVDGKSSQATGLSGTLFNLIID